MIFSDTEMMKLGIKHTTNIHNTKSLICTLKYVLDILQTEEAFTVEEYKHTQTHTHTHTHTHTRKQYTSKIEGPDKNGLTSKICLTLFVTFLGKLLRLNKTINARI